MRSGYSKDEFLLAAAKNKPRLQALVDNVANMTLEEISGLSEALWVKEALSILKASNGMGQKERINKILEAADEADKLAAQQPKPTYEVRLWDSGPEFIGTDLGYQHGWKIQVDTGDSFLIVDEEQVRFGDSVLKVDAHNRYPLMQNSRLIGYMTLENYKGFTRALLNQRHKL